MLIGGNSHLIWCPHNKVKLPFILAEWFGIGHHTHVATYIEVGFIRPFQWINNFSIIANILIHSCDTNHKVTYKEKKVTLDVWKL